MNAFSDDEKYWPILAEALADSPDSNAVQARIIYKVGDTLRAISFRHIIGQLNIARALNVMWNTYSIVNPNETIIAKGFSFLRLLCNIYELADVPLSEKDALVLYYLKRYGALVVPIEEEEVVSEILSLKNNGMSTSEASVELVLNRLPEDPQLARVENFKCCIDLESIAINF